MAAFSIEWHAGNLVNMRLYLIRKRHELKLLTAEVARIESDCDSYQQQIDAAHLEGKSAFDRERYKVAKEVV